MLGVTSQAGRPTVFDGHNPAARIRAVHRTYAHDLLLVFVGWNSVQFDTFWQAKGPKWAI
jgi:hypothetical protein